MRLMDKLSVFQLEPQTGVLLINIMTQTIMNVSNVETNALVVMMILVVYYVRKGLRK